MIELDLPYPPSVNTYWRYANNRVLISQKGRQYKRAVKACVLESNASVLFNGRISVTVVVRPPDRRQRDIDNCLKAVLDALASAGVYRDDFQVDHIEVYRGELFKPDGKVEVTVQEIEIIEV